MSPPTCGDHGCGGNPGDRYWGRGIGGGPVPELTLGVIPPARHRAVRQDSTGVSCAGRDGDSAGDFGHYHWDRRILGGRASVNLTSFVVPPAADRVVRKNSA